MAVTSVHIYYPDGGTTAYDLRKIDSWYEPSPNPDSIVMVRFTGMPSVTVQFDLVAFEAAKQASLGGGG